ncbi:MAG: hypothetical protein KBC56_01180 [Flavobacterium sp.]|nr:hypothetical protein [Flavobacterium sp.]
MKYFLSLLVSFLVLTGCDDGDIIEETFNFANATVQKCASSSVLYKISDNEALVLNTPETTFPNAEGTQTIPVSGTTSILYKKYGTTTTSENICGTPTLPVVEEWFVTGGSIEVISTKIFDTTNPTEVIAYNHKITFKNITFTAPTKQVVYANYEFGNYRTEVIDLAFDYDTAITQTCPGNNLIFKFNNTNALLLDVDPALFDHTIGTKTALISTTNKVTYRVYNGSLNTNFFCSAIPPTSPTLTEEWIAEDGVTSTSGIIKVETTVDSPTTYKHVIKLYNTTFKKGVKTYSPAPNADYTFGEWITN